ncbi:MAG: hypothetical protein ACYCOU_17655 [Sulfobacillus sp.]
MNPDEMYRVSPNPEDPSILDIAGGIGIYEPGLWGDKLEGVYSPKTVALVVPPNADANKTIEQGLARPLMKKELAGFLSNMSRQGMVLVQDDYTIWDPLYPELQRAIKQRGGCFFSGSNGSRARRF